MSLKIILILLALSGLGGIAFGYVLRVLIGLAQRGSVELDTKQKLLVAREEFLDERQRDLDAKGDELQEKEDEAEEAKRVAEDLIKERTKILERVSHLSEAVARDELLKEVERESEEAILLRLQKLEAHGRDVLEEKARAILTTAVHRLGNAG